MYRYHLYAQSTFFDFADSIHVSSQLVAPSFGISSLTGAFFASSEPVVIGHVGPSQASPLAISSALSAEPDQYFLSSFRCFLSRETVASNCFLFSSYGSLIPSPRCVLAKYSAASAIWIGLSGMVILPLYLGL